MILPWFSYGFAPSPSPFTRPLPLPIRPPLHPPLGVALEKKLLDRIDQITSLSSHGPNSATEDTINEAVTKLLLTAHDEIQVALDAASMLLSSSKGRPMGRRGSRTGASFAR